MEANDIPVDKAVRMNVKVREAKRELSQRFKEEEEALNEDLDQLDAIIQQHLVNSGSKSGTTMDGHQFYRQERRRYTTTDWSALNKVIMEHGVPELLEKRIHQGNMRQFLEDNPEVLPAGLRCDSQYTVTVRRAKK